jgi:hypothetical protein
VKFGFSLRSALVVTTLVGCFLYWRTLPTSVAEHFKRAVADKRYHEVWRLVENLDLDVVDLARSTTRVDVDVKFDDPTVKDWVVGQRRGRYNVRIRGIYSVELQQSGDLVAAAAGIRTTSAFVSTGGGIEIPGQERTWW